MGIRPGALKTETLVSSYSVKSQYLVPAFS